MTLQSLGLALDCKWHRSPKANGRKFFCSLLTESLIGVPVSPFPVSPFILKMTLTDCWRDLLRSALAAQESVRDNV